MISHQKTQVSIQWGGHLTRGPKENRFPVLRFVFYFVVIVVVAAVLGTESKSSATKLYPHPVHVCVRTHIHTRPTQIST